MQLDCHKQVSYVWCPQIEAIRTGNQKEKQQTTNKEPVYCYGVDGNVPRTPEKIHWYDEELELLNS